LISFGRDRGAFLFYVEGFVSRAFPLVGFRESRHWHVLPPPADAPRLQDSEMGGILLDGLRHAGARRWPDFLGGDAPHSSSILRSRRGSALPARRQVVGARGLDSRGQVDASRHF